MDQNTPRIRQLMALAEQALHTAQVNLDVDDYRATVNRGYYATFYAARAMLLTKGVERRKHSSVVSAFREHFVTSGLIEAEYSNVYGEALVLRDDADNAIEIPIDFDMAKTALHQARHFVQRMSEHLVDKGYRDESTT